MLVVGWPRCLDLGQGLVGVDVAGAGAILQLREGVADVAIFGMWVWREFVRMAGCAVREQSRRCIGNFFIVLLVAGDAGCLRCAEVVQHIGR